MSTETPEQLTNGNHPEETQEEDNTGGTSLLSLMTQSCLHVTDRESSFTGLFQITVKLPHEPYKIQVMVGIMSTGVMRLEE